jgi:hypothetical protein
MIKAKHERAEWILNEEFLKTDWESGRFEHLGKH